MALIRSKPTSPGRRFRIKVNNSDLHKGKPCESLVAKLSKTGGRNNKGRITTTKSFKNQISSRLNA